MRLHGEIDVGAPAARVFEVISTPERLPEWNPAAARARRIGDGPIGHGSRAAMVGLVLGQEIQSETEVVRFEPPRAFVTRAVRGPRIQTTFTLEPTAMGCRVVSDVEGDMPGGRLGAFLAEGALRTDFDRSLHRLKALCEAEAARAASAEPLEGSDAACWLHEQPGAD